MSSGTGPPEGWAGVRVAVCVPAFGRPAGLVELARALDQQDLPREQRALVVAVDGPDPALEAAARGVADSVVVLEVNRGSYAARNAALDAVPDHVPYVVFTDTDCRPDAGWLRAHLQALEAGAPLTGGAVELEVRPRPSAAEFVDATRFLQQEHLVTSAGFAATCNLGVRADLVRRLRFDERLRSGGDREFGVRAAQAGYAVAYVPAAVVRHPARARARDLLRKTVRTARGTRTLAALGLTPPAPTRAAPRPGPGEWAAARRVEVPAWWRTRTWAMARTTSVVWAVCSGQAPGRRPR